MAVLAHEVFRCLLFEHVPGILCKLVCTSASPFSEANLRHGCAWNLL